MILLYDELCNYFIICVCVCVPIHVRLFGTPYTVAHQVPLSVEFFRQGVLEWVAISSPGNLPDPGIECAPLASPALAGGLLTTCATWEAPKR